MSNWTYHTHGVIEYQIAQDDEHGGVEYTVTSKPEFATNAYGWLTVIREDGLEAAIDWQAVRTENGWDVTKDEQTTEPFWRNGHYLNSSELDDLEAAEGDLNKLWRDSYGWVDFSQVAKNL
jgi:hypothetical protein